MERHKALTLKAIVLAMTACLQTGSAETISAPNLVAAAGTSGSFDILLTNVGGEIGAFSFDIVASDPRLQFTNATVATTVPYVFVGNSFDQINGFPLATKTGQELLASDAANNGSMVVFAPVALGRVFYTVAPSIPVDSSIAITFGAATSLVGPSGYRFPISTVNGAITIVPEPDQMPLLFALLLVVLRVSGIVVRYRNNEC